MKRRVQLQPERVSATSFLAQQATEKARRELELGCELCGDPWRDHFSKDGRPTGCRK